MELGNISTPLHPLKFREVPAWGERRHTASKPLSRYKGFQAWELSRELTAPVLRESLLRYRVAENTGSEVKWLPAFCGPPASAFSRVCWPRPEVSSGPPEETSGNLFNPEGTMPEEDQHPQPMSRAEMLANAAGAYLQTVTNGFIVSNPQCTPQELWTAIATGMGRVLSAATKCQKPEETVALRSAFKELVNKGMSFVPAIDRAVDVPDPANSNIVMPLRRH